ncbi:MAG: hypothetical protein IPJ31_06935 [Bacteroidetes bacterium]|nr:hypothetical protein [Bacteroidota bacterium]
MSDNNKETADYSNITEAKPIAFSEADKLEKYKFPIGLEQAIETAILLGNLCLLQVSQAMVKHRPRHKLKSILNVDIFQFHTKSTSTVQDLLYQYDIMQHYADKNIENKVDVKTESYIRKSAFYNAIEYQNNNPDKQCVVLIDEIDKAPRDFPNDLLHEMEKYSFNIKEISQEFKLNVGL